MIGDFLLPDVRVRISGHPIASSILLLMPVHGGCGVLLLLQIIRMQLGVA